MCVYIYIYIYICVYIYIYIYIYIYMCVCVCIYCNFFYGPPVGHPHSLFIYRGTTPWLSSIKIIVLLHAWSHGQTATYIDLYFVILQVHGLCDKDVMDSKQGRQDCSSLRKQVPVSNLPTSRVYKNIDPNGKASIAKKERIGPTKSSCLPEGEKHTMVSVLGSKICIPRVVAGDFSDFSLLSLKPWEHGLSMDNEITDQVWITLRNTCIYLCWLKWMSQSRVNKSIHKMKALPNCEF